MEIALLCIGLISIATFAVWVWAIVAATRVSFFAVVVNVVVFPISTIIYAHLLGADPLRRPANIMIVLLVLHGITGYFYTSAETDELYSFYTTEVSECAKTYADNRAYVDIKYLTEGEMEDGLLPEIQIPGQANRELFWTCLNTASREYGELIQLLMTEESTQDKALVLEMFNVTQARS